MPFFFFFFLSLLKFYNNLSGSIEYKINMDSIDLRADLETDEDGGMSHYLCHLYEQINSYGVFHGNDPFDFSLPLLLLQISLLSTFTLIVRLILKPLGQPLIVSQILVRIFL